MGNVQDPSNTFVRAAGRSVNSGAKVDSDRCRLQRIAHRSEALPPGLLDDRRVDCAKHVASHFAAIIPGISSSHNGYHVERLARRALAEHRCGRASSRPDLLARKSASFHRHVTIGLTTARGAARRSKIALEDAKTAQRSLLPPISQRTVQKNKAIATAIVNGAAIDDLAISIAGRMATGGKPGYVEISDFMSVLSKAAPERWSRLRSDVACQLYGLPAHRFGKLVQNEPIREADFTDKANVN